MKYEQTLLWDKPKAKARPRVTKYGTYTEKATVDAERNLREQYEAGGGPKFDGPIAVTIDFSNTEVRLSVATCDDYENRKLTGDVDNYGKLVLDALNKIAYEDDKQIVSLLIRKL